MTRESNRFGLFLRIEVRQALVKGVDEKILLKVAPERRLGLGNYRTGLGDQSWMDDVRDLMHTKLCLVCSLVAIANRSYYC